MRISDWSSDVCSSDLGRLSALKFSFGSGKVPACDGISAAANARSRSSISPGLPSTAMRRASGKVNADIGSAVSVGDRSEEHTSELQSLMRISYAVFCLKKNKTLKNTIQTTINHNTHIK